MLRRIHRPIVSGLQSALRCSSNLPATSRPNADPEFLHIDEQFRKIRKEDRNKATFLATIKAFQNNQMRTRGHVEFLNTAVKYLKEFNLHKDLEVYKAMLNVFPKGPLIPTNTFQKMFMHYPLQQHCCVKVLDEMEWNGVQPDKEIHDIVVNAFGEWNFASRKIKRMLYWMPKLKYTNKYLDRRHVEGVPLDAVALARVALRMMSRDPGTMYTVVQALSNKDTEESQWIVSAQSPLQKAIVQKLGDKPTLYVDGPNLVYVMDKRVEYFVLTGDPTDADFDDFMEQSELYDMKNLGQKIYNEKKPRPTVHEQPDRTILAMAVFEEPTESLATSWVNHVFDITPSLANANVLFRVKKPGLNARVDDDAQ